ncbi:MAG: TlpA disulfide reductase family protein [Pseudomonadota bacterium]
MNSVTLGPLVFESVRFAAMLRIAVLFLLATLADRLALTRLQAAGPVAPTVSAAVWPAFLGWVLVARLAWLALHWTEHAALSLALTCGVASAAGGLALLLLTDVRSLTMPDQVLSDLSDMPLPLIHREGTLVVNLWASWCPTCRRELPMMIEQANSPGAPHFVFANQGEAPAQVKDFLARAGLGPNHVALDPGYGLMAARDAAGLPATLFFDASGGLVAVNVGEISRADLSRRMMALTEETE